MTSKDYPAEQNENDQLEKNYRKSFFASLNEMRKSEINTDVVIICGEKKFPAHRLVLSVGSRYFKTLFESSDFSREIDHHVEESTLKFILDFLYLSVNTEILFDDVDFLFDIFETSLVLEATELTNYCWKLMKPSVTIDYYFSILATKVLYDESLQYTEDALQFVLVNFKAIVRHEKFLSLNETWMKFLLKKFRVKRVPIEDFMMEGILRWIKEDEKNRKFLLIFFFYFNYELTSKEYIKQLRENKSSALSDNLKTYLKVMVEPKLKTTTDITEILENMSIVMNSNEENAPMSFIYLGYSSVKDAKFSVIKRSAFKIKDTNGVYRTVFLPSNFDKLIVTFQHQSLFYFVAQNATKSWDQHLLCCDLQSEEFVLNVYLPDKLTVIDGCKIEDVVYMISRVEMRHEITYYSEQEKIWGSVSVGSAHLITCVNIGNFLYVLVCNESKVTCYCKYYFITIKDRRLMNFKTKDIALRSMVVLNNNLIAVYQGKIFIFFYNDTSLLAEVNQVAIYDPAKNQWDRKEITYKGNNKDDLAPIKCCSAKNKGIILYTRLGSTLLYNVRQNELREFHF